MIGLHELMRVVIIGAGGFGREILDVLRDHEAHRAAGSERLEFAGFLDDGAPDLARLSRLGVELLGGTDLLPSLVGYGFCIGISDPVARQRIAERAESAGLTPLTLRHSTATIGADSHVGAGSVLCAGVRVTTNVAIGRHAHLNLNVTVGHDTVVGDYVTVNPLTAISGEVHLADRVVVGTAASVNQGLTIGEGATVGAGAAVVKNVSPGVTVVGVPARER